MCVFVKDTQTVYDPSDGRQSISTSDYQSFRPIVLPLGLAGTQSFHRMVPLGLAKTPSFQPLVSLAQYSKNYSDSRALFHGQLPSHYLTHGSARDPSNCHTSMSRHPSRHRHGMNILSWNLTVPPVVGCRGWTATVLFFYQPPWILFAILTLPFDYYLICAVPRACHGLAMGFRDPPMPVLLTWAFMAQPRQCHRRSSTATALPAFMGLLLQAWPCHCHDKALPLTSLFMAHP